jgi:CHASE2 domain-containing sensor protein
VAEGARVQGPLVLVEIAIALRYGEVPFVRPELAVTSTPSVSARRDGWLKRTLKQNGRNVLAILVAPLMIFGAYSFQLLNVGGISDWISRHYFSLVSHTAKRMMRDDIRLVYISEKDPELGDFTTDLVRERARRKHADLVRSLEKAGASIVAFDLYFKTPMQDPIAQAGTADFVSAVKEINARGKTRVIVGHTSDLGQTLVSSLPQETWGDVEVVDEESKDEQRMVENAIVVLKQGLKTGDGIQEVLSVPVPMALKVAMSKMAGGSDTITVGTDAERREVVLYQNGNALRRFRTKMDLCTRPEVDCKFDNSRFQWQSKALMPFAMSYFDEAARIPYQTALKTSSQGSDFRGKIVFVGAETSEEKRSARGTIPSSGLYGYEVQAGITSDLLSDSWLRRLTPVGEFLALYVFAIVTVLARRFLPKTDVEVDTHFVGTRKLPAGLLILIVVYAVAAVIAYSKQNLLLEPGYDVAVIGLVYFWVSRPAKKSEMQEWL